MFRHIDFEEINRVPHFPGAEHQIDCRKNHSGNALILQRIVGIRFVLHRSMAYLNQSRLEIDTGSGNAYRD